MCVGPTLRACVPVCVPPHASRVCVCIDTLPSPASVHISACPDVHAQHAARGASAALGLATGREQGSLLGRPPSWAGRDVLRGLPHQPAALLGLALPPLLLHQRGTLGPERRPELRRSPPP